MYYYKFVNSVVACSNLVRGRLKFTPIPFLNDPSEMFPVFEISKVRSSLADLRQRGYSDEEFEWLRKQGLLLQKLAPEKQVIPVPGTKELATLTIRNSFYDNHDTLRRLVSEVTDTILANTGIFCVSERFEAFPMWAHYANNAQGFAVEFKNLPDAFSGDETSTLNQLREVQYDSSRLGMTFYPASHLNMFFSKLNDWSYEKELRVVKALTDCQQEKVDDRVTHLFQVDTNYISRIILGWNVREETERALRSKLKNYGVSVKIDRAEVVNGRIFA